MKIGVIALKRGHTCLKISHRVSADVLWHISCWQLNEKFTQHAYSDHCDVLLHFLCFMAFLVYTLVFHYDVMCICWSCCTVLNL